jgi:beta-N-acetylhexosaminidase
VEIKAGTRVLSYHFRGDPQKHVDRFDGLLEDRGARVTRFDETEVGKIPEDGLEAFDLVLLSAVFCPSWGTSLIRPAGTYMRDVWALITSFHPGLVVVSYGTPYLIYEMPHLPCLINGYSPDLNTQRAVLELLTGQLEPTGTSPVDLDRPYRFKSPDLFQASSPAKDKK